MTGATKGGFKFEIELSTGNYEIDQYNPKPFE